MNTKRAGLMVLILVALWALLWLLRPSGPPRERPATAPAPAEPSALAAGREELKKFQGVWEFAALEVDGNPRPDGEVRKLTVEFKDDQWIVSEGSNILAQCAIVLDPTTSPRMIDAYPLPGKGLPIHGIYRFENDTLTICDRGENQGNRPDDFDTEPNSGLVRIVYRRPPR